MTGKSLDEKIKKRTGKVQIFMVLFFIFFGMGFCQNNNAAADDEKKLREKIMAVYQSKGEQAVRNFYKKKNEKITNDFIVDFAKAGVKERKEEWLNSCKIMAEEKKDKNTLADVIYNMGEYFRLTLDYNKALDYFENAFSIYQELNHLVGQGNVFKSKGNVHFVKGDYTNANKMYDKALALYEKGGGLIGQGDVYLRKGFIYTYKSDYADAHKMYDKAMAFYEKAGDIIGKGNSLKEIGIIYFYKGDNITAEKMYDKALDLFKKGHGLIGQGDIYWRKGYLYFFRGDHTNAEKMYDKAMIFYKKGKGLFGQGLVLREKGNICYCRGDLLNAEKMYDKALVFFEKIGDIIDQGNIFEKKGDIYLYKGEYTRAQEMCDKALVFFQKVDDYLSQGNVLLTKGDIHFYSGELINAKKMYDRALIFLEKSGDSLGMGNVYWRKGELYLQKGEVYQAFESFNKAISFHEKANEPRSLGNSYLAKGDIYYKIGDNAKALEIYDKALLLFEKSGSPLDAGNAYNMKGVIFSSEKNNSKAIEMLDKALFLFNKVGHNLGLGNVYLEKGNIYFLNSNYPDAEKMYDKAFEYYDKAGSHLGKGNVCLKKGELYFKNNIYPDALDMHNKAISFYSRIGQIESKSFAIHGKAKVFTNQGKKVEAIRLFEKAISTLEKVRNKTPISEMKMNYLKSVYNYYEEAAEFMMNQKYYRKGFRYSESLKARIFLEQLAEGMVKVDRGLSPELRERRDMLVWKLSEVKQMIADKIGENNRDNLAQLKKKRDKLEIELDNVIFNIHQKNPRYASVQYSRPIEIKDLQQRTLKEDELLIEYFVPGKDVYIFLVAKDDFKVFKLRRGKGVINKAVKDYLYSISSLPPGKKDRTIMKKNLSAGTTLYSLIFKPIENDIKGRKIIIVPDGEIAKIPFEALIIENNNKTKKPVYLIEKYSIQYIQSASVLSMLREHYQGKRKTNSFIGFGDPVYDYENFKQGKLEHGTIIRSVNETDEIKEIHRTRYARDGGKLNRLPKSGEEIKDIARLFEKVSQQQVVRIRTQAMEENVKAANMKNFDFIHIACHGLLNDDFQSLVLSQDIPGAKEDGYLTLNEIMNCDFHAKLVVLSACRTGTGKVERGEGITGLTRAVMYAGTPAVVASLWEVESTATKKLMINFYRNMLEHKIDKTEALRQAKLELLKSKKYSSPYFWSAFVMYGE